VSHKLQITRASAVNLQQNIVSLQCGQVPSIFSKMSSYQKIILSKA
jgi:hypothetical protein